MNDNREYAIALQFVQRKYNSLYQMAEAVVLTPKAMFPTGQQGQCSYDNFVSISDGLKTVGDYVDVLVHELTHCKQNKASVRLTEKEKEEEAYAAGILAATEYMREAAPWTKK